MANAEIQAPRVAKARNVNACGRSGAHEPEYRRAEFGYLRRARRECAHAQHRARSTISGKGISRAGYNITMSHGQILRMMFLDLIKREKRGNLKVYLGSAAGVGKTYRMLLEGKYLKERGADVVIGYMEPHERPETIAQAEGLEVVPPRIMKHHHLELKELDVDAVHSRGIRPSRSWTSSRTRTLPAPPPKAVRRRRGIARRRHQRHHHAQYPAPRVAL